MAKTAQEKHAETKTARRRMTEEEIAEAVQRLQRGERAKDIAADMGFSEAAIYYARARLRRVENAYNGHNGGNGASELRTQLVSYAVRHLIGQEVPPDERAELQVAVQQELLRRVAEGI